MSNVDFDTNSNTLSHHTAHSDIYVPTTTDGTPIRWIGDNDATIDGTLYEVGRFYKRSGLFQSYFRHHAVALSNGKLAIDSINSVYFISGKINDGHDFDDPCPPHGRTSRRLQRRGHSGRHSNRQAAEEDTGRVHPLNRHCRAHR